MWILEDESSSEDEEFATLSLESRQYFWINAICIDQEKNSERNHQVRIMTQIYETAIFVCVWLGNEYGNVLRHLATLSPVQLEDAFAFHYNTLGNHEPNALSHFMEAQYWTRMWVVQEFALAAVILLAAGSALVSWSRCVNAFITLRKTLRNRPSIGVANTASIHLAVVSSRIHIKGNYGRYMRSLPAIFPEEKIGERLLFIVLSNFRDMKCADVRDRIFAIDSLVEEGSNGTQLLQINCNLSPRKLCLDVLRRTLCLARLVFSTRGPGIANLRRVCPCPLTPGSSPIPSAMELQYLYVGH